MGACTFSSCVENIWGPRRVSFCGLLSELDGVVRVSEVFTFVCHVQLAAGDDILLGPDDYLVEIGVGVRNKDGFHVLHGAVAWVIYEAGVAAMWCGGVKDPVRMSNLH